MRGPEVVTMGETMVLLYSSDPAVQLADTRQLTMDCAGADSNFAIAMTRLGFRVGWISRVGEDPLGEFVVTAIANEGVDVSQVKRDGRGPTGVFFKYQTPTSETRVIYYRRASAASRLGPEDVSAEYFADASWLHLNGMTCALSADCARAFKQAIRLAVANNVSVSIDLNLRLQLWSVEAARRVLLPLLSKVSILFGTEDEFLTLFRVPSLPAALSAAARHGPKTVVAKRGRRGAIALVRESMISHGGFAPPEVVDTVGAGDGFNAAFVASVFRGMNSEQALRYANLAGAAAATTPGDFQGYLTWAQLEHYASSWQERVTADE